MLAVVAGGIALLTVGWLSAVVMTCPAGANTCASDCRFRHNQCRIDTKGSSRCDAALQACLRGCLAGRQR